MKKIPKARGPYSLSVRAGDFVFVAGQLPIDPHTEELVEGDIGKMTNQVIDNLEAVLEHEGMGLKDVVKCDVFLKDMADAPGMNQAYEKRFSHGRPPARATVQVAKLPMDVRVEIACVAYRLQK